MHLLTGTPIYMVYFLSRSCQIRSSCYHRNNKIPHDYPFLLALLSCRQRAPQRHVPRVSQAKAARDRQHGPASATGHHSSQFRH